MAEILLKPEAMAVRMSAPAPIPTATDADSRVYDKSEIEQFDLTLTQRAINELFARHGYIFKEDDVMRYFTENTSWYVPRYESVDPKTDFNNYEYKNYLMLVDWRAELKK